MLRFIIGLRLTLEPNPRFCNRFMKVNPGA
jgi:hypothetical protein